MATKQAQQLQAGDQLKSPFPLVPRLQLIPGMLEKREKVLKVARVAPWHDGRTAVTFESGVTRLFAPEADIDIE